MRKVLVLFLLSVSLSVMAQNEYEDLSFHSLENKKIVKSNADNPLSFKLSFLFPAVGTEIRLADKFSLDISAKLNAVVGVTGSSSNPNLVFFPFPVIHAEPKWNYNIKKRAAKGKKVNHFSSNFVSLYSSYRLKVSQYTNHSILIGPTWGMQRNLGTIGFFKLNTGLGVHHYLSNFANQPYKTSILPIVDVQLGIVF